MAWESRRGLALGTQPSAPHGGRRGGPLPAGTLCNAGERLRRRCPGLSMGRSGEWGRFARRAGNEHPAREKAFGRHHLPGCLPRRHPAAEPPARQRAEPAGPADPSPPVGSRSRLGSPYATAAASRGGAARRGGRRNPGGHPNFIPRTRAFLPAAHRGAPSIPRPAPGRG